MPELVQPQPLPRPLRETSHPALYYQDMLADSRRMRLYRQAIMQVVKPGDVVVDLGTGLGVLAVMAAQAGARRVYAVDIRPQVMPHADRVIADNGFSDIITLVQADASKLELPEPVDVIINELIGDFGTDENIHECVQPVAAAYLKPGGRVIPSRLTTHLVGVSYEAEFRGVYTGDYEGLNLSGALQSELAFDPAPIMYGLRRRPRELTSVATVENIDFEAPLSDRRYQHPVQLEVVADGDLQGLVGFFRSQLAPGVDLDNYPCYPGCHWVNWHWPWVPFKPIRVGDVLNGMLITPALTVASVWRWQD